MLTSSTVRGVDNTRTTEGGTIAGYEVAERGYRGSRSRVLPATDPHDRRRVVLKLPASDYPTEDDLRRLRLEHDLLAAVDHPGVVRPLALRTMGASLALVLEHVPGITLAEHIDGKPLPVAEALRIARGLAEALEAIHAKGIVHRDVSTANAIVQPKTGMVRLIDFDNAAIVARRVAATRDPGGLRGTLAYIAPEATGRLNRLVDYRADLYSLGAVLHHLVTGTSPFPSADPLELIHRHLAHEPPACHALVPTVPPLLSALVRRLLAKSPEDRYQSASGLRADLEEMERRLKAGEPLDFELLSRDVSAIFRLPEGLYGREAEAARLVESFERSSKAARLLLIGGYPGVGKSRLVRSLQERVVARGGFFVAGKFDALNRDVPFASLHEAFRDLVRQVMTEDEERAADWRTRLQDALGPNGRLVADVVPELERLIGETPPVPDLPARETRNRFNLAFGAFVKTFCAPEHPLCLFLDDLQWADSATLAWIEATLAEGTGSLHLVGAYRDNEVPLSHPLAVMLQRLEAGGGPLDLVTLSPLAEAPLERFVADAVRDDVDSARPFANLVRRATGGNPFFVNQLLLALHEEGELRLDPQRLAWTLDLDRVERRGVADDVVDLLLGRIERLREPARRALKGAACVGHAFSTEVVAEILGCETAELEEYMDEAVEAGLLQTDASGEYAFRHDRVQSAALEMLGEKEVQATRLRLGRRLKGHKGRLFEALGHLQAAEPLIDDPAERLDLARLNLAAAERARRSTAYAQALGHAKAAARLLPDDAPDGLRFGVAMEQAHGSHHLGDDESAARLYEEALSLAREDGERAEVFESQVHFLTNRAEFAQAYETGRMGAASFGVRLPARFAPPLLLRDLGAIEAAMRGKTVASLVDLPAMSDARLLVGSRLATASLKAAYQVRPELCVAGAAALVRVCLKSGNFEDCAVAYLPVGPIFRSGVLGRHESGFEWGKLCLALQERFDSARLRSEVNFVYAYFSHSWMRPLETTEAYFRAAYVAGIESGDVFHASCACSGLTQSLLMRGVSLPEVTAECDRYLGFLRSVGNAENLGTVLALRQLAANLRGTTLGRTSFGDSEFDEVAFEREIEDYGSRHFAHFYWVDRLLAAVLWGDLDEAVRAASRSEGYLKDSLGMQHAAEHVFLAGLLGSDLLASGRPGPRRAWLRTLRRAAMRFRRWARRCPENFASKAALLGAESSRAMGRRDTAKLYDEAIELAAKYGMGYVEALAAERAARHHAATGHARAARFYARDAVYAFRRWGAAAVADAVSARHCDLPSNAPEGLGTRSVGVTTEPMSNLDVESMLKSARAIAAEVRLPSLLAMLLEIVMENAGADRGLLLLPQGGAYVVQAEGTPAGTTVMEGVALADHPTIARSVVNYVVRSRETVVLNGATGRFAADPHLTGARAPRSLLCAPLVNRGGLSGVLYLENGHTGDVFTEARQELLTLLSGQFAISIENALSYETLEGKVRERTEELRSRNDLIRRIFGRYNSDDVVDRLLEEPEGLQMGGELREITVLSSDMRGFTAKTGTLPAESVVRLVNNYCEAMTEVVTRYGGMVNELTGDGMLVMFGAPNELEDHAARGVACAIAMQEAMRKANRRNVDEGLPEMGMGVGVCTGAVVVGNIGSLQRTKYSAIGMAVNLACRIESYTSAGQVMISERTRTIVGDAVSVRDRMEVEPKGAGKVAIYEIDGIAGEFNLSLPVVSSETTPVRGRVEMRLIVLKNKQALGDPISARVLRLSATEAVLQSDACPPPMTDVTLRASIEGLDLLEVGFAKVVAGEPTNGANLRLRFTLLPDAVARALRETMETKPE